MAHSAPTTCVTTARRAVPAANRSAHVEGALSEETATSVCNPFGQHRGPLLTQWRFHCCNHCLIHEPENIGSKTGIIESAWEAVR